MKPNLTILTRNAMRLTQEVTERWPSRLVGSDACLACGAFLEEKMQSFCDSTSTQPFSIRPGAFLGFIRVNIVLYLLGLLALYLQQVAAAAALATLSLVVLVVQFLFYREFIDFLYPRKTGMNVVGVIEPAETVTQQVIISAHHDSAHVFNFLANDPKSYNRKVMSGILSMVVMLLFAWLLLVFNWLDYHLPVLYWILTGVLTLFAVWVIRLWFFYAKEGTPGAGDNMVCTAIALEVGNYFAEQKAAGKGLRHTRLVVASWDGEEAGLRGARHYVKQQREALHNVKSYNLNLECMYDHRELSFLTSDLNSFVPLSVDMAEECVQIAARLGYEMKTTPLPLLAGGTDAAEFAKAGIEATTLGAMDWETKGEDPAYHTLKDTIDAVDEEAVRQSIALGIAYVVEKDGEGSAI